MKYLWEQGSARWYDRFSVLRHMQRKRMYFAILLVLFSAVPTAIIISRSNMKALACVCNVFSAPTGQVNVSEVTSLELGFKFKPTIDGNITGVRFYKQGAMSGTHTGRLWTTGGSPLATATFTNETASGWQEVTFSSPVTVTANTTYVASVTMADGRYVATSNYFTSDIVNGPLTAPSSASSGGNGVFNSPGGSFPSSSFNASNYWIDVSFFGTAPPTVTAVAPTADATGVELADTVSATFDQSMDASTLTSSTFSVKDAQNNPVDGTLSYNNTTRTASFIPNTSFTLGATYTATVEGGTGTVAKNAANIALASDYTWSFTITTTEDDCPCSLKNRTNPAGSSTFDDSGSSELGVKIKPSTNGYITALRFYKPITSTETSHTGNIWSSTGTKLASATFTNESDYGWQEAKLSTPLRVYENQLYIISYGTTTATYQALAGSFSSNITSGYLTAYADNSAENAATGSGNRTGVFATSSGSYPNVGSTNGSYYFVDAVFSIEPTPEPLSVTVTQPTTNAYGVMRDQPITATFNRSLDGATVTNSTFRLFDTSNNQVSGTGSYDTAKGMATFTPSSTLSYGQRYTARLSASIADQGGTQLGSEYSWSFTVGSALSTNPLQGSGGPILVVTTASNKYSQYYAEIMRTEGINYFDVKDIAAVNTATLNQYDAVVLSEMSLSQSQADMFETWVAGGGNLIAMRPDGKLADLLGLTDVGTTRANQYLLIDTDTAPGKGLVDETIQYKGTADNYTLNGATSVAHFYSNAGSGSGTANPAVTMRLVGSKGGTAAAFTYDLAKSVIALHQGNQAWVGQNRDNNGPARGNDLFYGAMSGDIQPDWVDMSKFHIPQADEQQRLLANVLLEATKDKKPLPRFWYLPGDHKAALIMTGDDHGLSNTIGTEKIMNKWLNESTTDCSIVDWECVRASHYVYVGSALTNTRALQYHNLGFEIGDHIDAGCSNYPSYAFLNTAYANSLATWRAKYTSIPNQVTHRVHCYVWSDWDSQPRADLSNGIRFDLNYVAFPNTWVNSRAPLMTGSGMNMRFTDADGDMIDVRQGVTNFDNTSANTASINGLLDNALGVDGHYGLFGTHYDMSDSYDATLHSAAKARNIPIISSAQALTWLDGRSSSNFNNFSGSNGQFTFTIAAAVGANRLKAMMPLQDAAGTLTSIKLAGAAISYQTQTIKGVRYAVFDSTPGDYTVTYSDYNPSTGGNGGSSGSDSGQAPSNNNGSKSATRKTTAPAKTAFEDQQPPSVEEDTESPVDSEDPSTRQPSPSDDTPDTAKNSAGKTLLAVTLGLFVAASIIGGAVLWHRHSSRNFPGI